MRKFQKTFLFLFILNAFFLLLVVFLLPPRFLISIFAFALILDGFLVFFMTSFVKKNYLFSSFSPNDSYSLNSLFGQLKRQYGLKKIQLLKLTEVDSACFYLSDLSGSMIVISENILESFNQEDIACFLSYAFQKIKTGDALFLTVLSSFLFVVEKFFYVLSYPFISFKKQKEKVLGMSLVFRVLSLVTRNLFYKNDRLLHQSSLRESPTEKALNEKRRNQALFLWKLESFLSLNPPDMPRFFAPVFLTNFLTGFDKKDYISLQPLIKNRVKKLVGSYPP